MMKGWMIETDMTTGTMTGTMTATTEDTTAVQEGAVAAVEVAVAAKGTEIRMATTGITRLATRDSTRWPDPITHRQRFFAFG